MFTKLDFPTLDRPTKAASGGPASGKVSVWEALSRGKDEGEKMGL